MKEEAIEEYNERRPLFKQPYLDYHQDSNGSDKQSKAYLKAMISNIPTDELRMTVNNYYYNIRHDMAAILIKNCDEKLG